MKYRNMFKLTCSIAPLLGLENYLNVDLKMMNCNDVVCEQTELFPIMASGGC